MAILLFMCCRKRLFFLWTIISNNSPEMDEVTDGQVVDLWYTLDGIRLQGEPVLRGVYVNQRGEKRVVK